MAFPAAKIDKNNPLKVRRPQPSFGSINTPFSITLADHLTQEERDQILQTIEMFEVITGTNPDDYQSLEILKEAYWKIDRRQEGLVVTRRLADTYRRMGQYSSALLEYEGILQQEPNSKEIKAIMAELEGKLHHGKSVSGKTSIALDFGIDEAFESAETAPPGSGALEGFASAPALRLQADLIETAATTAAPEVARHQAAIPHEADGNESLAKFLVQHRLAPQETISAALMRVRQHASDHQIQNGSGRPSHALAASLLEEMGQSGLDLEGLVSGIIDRTNFAFVPLDYYEVDRQIVKTLPEELTLGHLIVPFDIVSRTMMVAIDNPFDVSAKAAVQQAVDYHIQWYLALPGIIRKILREVYRISE
jgi:hypothetical protein